MPMSHDGGVTTPAPDVKTPGAAPRSAFVEMAYRLQRPLAVSAVFKALGLSLTGGAAGAVPALALAADAMELLAARWGVKAAVDWAEFVRGLAREGGLMAAEAYVAMTSFDDDPGSDLLASIAKLSELHPAARSAVVLESLALAIFGALRNVTTVPAAVAAAILRMSRNVRRDKPGRDWQMLYDLDKLTEDGLTRVVAEVTGSECRLLANHLLGVWISHKNLDGPPLEGVQGEPPAPPAPPEPGPEEGRKKRRTGKKGPRIIQPPSVDHLRQRAAQADLHHAYNVDRVWDRLDADAVAEVTTQLAPLLAADAALLHMRMAVHALMAQRISRDYPQALRLRLQPGDKPDLWYDRVDRCLKFSRKRYLGLKGRADADDIHSVPIPAVLADAIERLWLLAPHAQELGHLLGYQDSAYWLAKVEKFVSGLGDPAHKPTSGRFVHALGLVHLHCGTSDVLSGMLSFNLVHSADSAPNYVGVPQAFIHARVAVVDAFLGLGPPSTEPADRLFGHPNVPTANVARADWAVLGLQVARAIVEIHAAQDVAAVERPFNAGMAAAAAAYRWPTAARDQMYQRLSLADAQVHPRYVCQDDKRTTPPSRRPIPRTPEVDQVIDAVFDLRRAALEKLRALGSRDADLPHLLRGDRPDQSLFVQLKMQAGTGERVRVTANPLKAGADSLKTLTRGADGLRRHAARCYWMSIIAQLPSPGWLGRALGGHARRDAGVGGWCQGMPPALLLDQLAQQMRVILGELALPAFLPGGARAARHHDLPLVLQLSRFARRKDPWALVPADLSQHYCMPSTLTAMCVTEALRGTLGDVLDDLDAPAHVLVSLVVGEGFRVADDVRRIWPTLPGLPTDGQSAVHRWQRASGQEIELPAQPWTLAHARRVKCWPTLDEAASQLRSWLQRRFPAIDWPAATGALLAALGWIVGLWARVECVPLVLHCDRPETRAATFNAASRLRLRGGWTGANVAPTVKTAILATTAPMADGKSELQELASEVWAVIGTGSRDGEDIRLSNKLRPHLDARFDREACRPVTRWLLHWIEHECIRWQSGMPDPNQLSTVYNNLTCLREVLDNNVAMDADPAEWSHFEWSELREVLLDVSEIVSEKSRASALVSRRKALNRIVSVLSEAGLYPASRGALTQAEADDGRWWPDSASRVFVPDEVFDAVRADARLLYARRPLESAQAEFLLDLTRDAAARRDESAAVFRDKVGKGKLALAATGVSRRKNDWASRFVVLDGALAMSTQALCALSDELYDDRTSLVSKQGLAFNLRFGRARQAVLTDLFRQRLAAPEFQWHSLRGMAVMEFLLRRWQPLVRQLLCEHMPLAAARSLVHALAGDGPSHAATSFNRSGHASHETACAAYLPCWPDLHAAMYRAAPGVPPPSLALVRALALDGRNQQSLNKARERGTDLWQWLLTPSGQRLHVSAAGAVVGASHVSVPQETDATSPANTLLFGVFTLLGLSRNAAMTHAPVAPEDADRCEQALRRALPLHQLHQSAVNRCDADMVPVRAMLRSFMAQPIATRLVTSIAERHVDAVSALRQLLCDHDTWLSLPRLRLALQALPLPLGLLVTWRIGRVDNRLAKALEHLHETRIVVGKPSGNVVGSVRLSVVGPAAVSTTGHPRTCPDPNQRHAACLSTTARMALEVHRLMLSQGETT